MIDTRKSRRIAGTAVLFGAMLMAPPAAMGAGAASPQGSPVALRGAEASIDQVLAAFSTSVVDAAGGLQSFMTEADVAEDKSMQDAGVAAKAKLDKGMSNLMAAARRAVPEAEELVISWDSASVNQCRKVDGQVLVGKGAAVCVTNGDRTDAQADGDGSAATANAGLGDYDERNKSTAVAVDGSLSTSDSSFGDRNESFAGSFANGEAHATNSSGDRNRAIALGANGSNDGNGPSGAQAYSLIGFDNTSLSVADGPNSTAFTNAGYGDRHKAAATSGPNSHARADSAQGEQSASFAQGTDRGHALAFNSYGDHLLAVAQSKGDGSSGLCSPYGQSAGSGQTTYPLDACAFSNARAVDGEANAAISIVDKAKGAAVSERGARNIAVTRAANGGDIVWNATPSLPNQPSNPHAGLTPDCPWPAAQGQQACGNATAKASYGDGNLAVGIQDGDHAFTWSEASGGSYNQTLSTAVGANSQARAQSIYNNYGTAKSTAANGGKANTLAVRGYENVAIANADGVGAVANATAVGPHARATASASAAGTATATHNTTNSTGFPGIGPTGVSCSDENVTYAVIGTGQKCGRGF